MAATRQTTKTKRAALYLRVSHDPNGDELGVNRQRKDARSLARARGWQIVDEYRENNTSAAKPGRTKYGAMLDGVERGEYEVVIAWDMSRLCRNARDRLRLVEVGKTHSLVVAMVRGSDLDMSTPAGRMTAGILGEVAQHEIDQKGDRQRAAYAQLADDGKPFRAGYRPFGFEADKTTPHPVEAPMLRKAYDDVLAGGSLSSIARQWNAAGVTTARGNQWRHQAVAQVLANPRNAGLRAYRGEVVGEAKWKPLVQPAVYEAVVAILSDASRRTNHSGGERRNLLTGLARCGVCGDGTTVVAGSGGGQRNYAAYRCSRAKHLQRRRDTLDEYVTDLVLERLGRDDAAELLTDADAENREALHVELTARRERRDVLAVEYEDGNISLAALRAATKRANARIAEIEDALAHRDRAPLLGPLVNATDTERPAVWDGYPLDRKQAVIGTLCEITLRKGKVGGNSRGVARKPVDPDTITVDWLS